MSSGEELTLGYVVASDSRTIELLIELGNQASRTLGLLPRAVYYEAASEDRLLAAWHGNEPVGYALFRLSWGRVALTHLCVRGDLRGRGIAHQLVNEVSAHHRARLGLLARCRDDYPNIALIWQALGFSALSKTRGRGRDRAPMTNWWRDHGHPHLYSALDEPATLPVAIDLNIIRDLCAPPDATRSRRSRVLYSPELVDRIELVITGGLERELQTQPEDRRAQLRREAARFPSRPGPKKIAAELFDLIRAAVTTRLPELKFDQNDIGDIWQIAEAAAAGLTILLTWDDRLRQIIAPVVRQIEGIPELANLRIIDPDHLVIRLDEITHSSEYQPKAIEGGGFSVELAGADSEPELMSFLETSKDEKRGQLRDRLREIARSGHERLIVRTSSGEAVACFSRFQVNDLLRVSLFRVGAQPAAETIARYLLWSLRRTAYQAGVKAVEIDDPHLSDVVIRAASHESYQRIGQRWYSWIVDAIGSGAEVTATANEAYRIAGVGSAPLLAPHLSAATAAQYERTWWPAKITDSDLPHFAVAIQQRWSPDLLGVPAVLTPRPDELALARELVYYRSGLRSTLKAPGRILWCVSGGPSGPRSFVGTSLLDAIDTDTPDALYSRLSHYGVFRLSHVREAAGDGNKVQALRVSNTEIFPSPVSWRSYLELLDSLPGPRGVLAPVKMPTATFGAIYKLGTSNRG